ncbi:MAG: cupin protein [Thermoleophilia bacterium]|nr:cupin protein [Thermoleophilia bacterium]
MTPFTRVHLTDLDDMAPKFGFGDVHEARFAAKALECEQTALMYLRIKPGQRGFSHHHEVQEELYVVLAGSGTAFLDEQEVALGALDAIRVAAGTERAFAAGDDGMDLLAFGAPAVSDGRNDAVMGAGASS